MSTESQPHELHAFQRLNQDRTNVPDIAMSFSDAPFPYGPFVPHAVARQYIENYFALHKIDQLLELNTTLEDLSLVPGTGRGGKKGAGQWKLTLRKYDPLRHLDVWREECFDAVVIANGHYSIPFVSYPVVRLVKTLADVSRGFLMLLA